MKLYLAGASKEVDRVRRAMIRLRALGHTITHDWTEDVLKYQETIPSEEILTRCAEEDFQGVFSCDALVLLSPEIQNITIGAWTELGIALGLHKPILISGKADKCIFSYLNTSKIQRLENDEKLLDELAGW